jgi:hypothetical protein
VNHEDGVIRVEHIDHLQESAAMSLALDQELVFAYLLRERRLGVSDNEFSFLGFDPMLGNMLLIPVDAPKLHDYFTAAIITRKARDLPELRLAGIEERA